MRWIAVAVAMASAAFAAWGGVTEWGWFLAAAVLVAILAMAGEFSGRRDE